MVQGSPSFGDDPSRGKGSSGGLISQQTVNWMDGYAITYSLLEELFIFLT